MTTNSGDANHNWKGGRSIASTGYVLVRVGVDHHLADVRGYAYEHRIVAEEMIGRRLLDGEIVHHINHDKQDNRPENLQVAADVAHHRILHRTVGFNLRMPGEDNPTVLCDCGCGQSFLLYDDSGRPRCYVSGHNPQSSPVIDFIMQALDDGIKTLKQLAELHGNSKAVKAACSKLAKQHRIVRVERGVYGRAN